MLCTLFFQSFIFSTPIHTNPFVSFAPNSKGLSYCLYKPLCLSAPNSRSLATVLCTLQLTTPATHNTRNTQNQCCVRCKCVKLPVLCALQHTTPATHNTQQHTTPVLCALQHSGAFFTCAPASLFFCFQAETMCGADAAYVALSTRPS